MDDLRRQAVDVLQGLTDEQLVMVLAYAQCLKDGEAPIPVSGFEEIVEETA